MSHEDFNLLWAEIEGYTAERKANAFSRPTIRKAMFGAADIGHKILSQ
jgi:hypothetical protein